MSDLNVPLATGAKPPLIEALRLEAPEVLPVALAGTGTLCIHRLDQLFAVASGNKIFKLIGHFLAAQRAGKTHLLSFGGAWSNHLHALAVFSSHYQMQTTAIVRGLHVDLDNPTLRDARHHGMRIHRVSKEEYAARHQRGYRAQLQQRFPDAWIIPEGGDDAYGRWGMRLLATSMQNSIPAGETLVVPSGTGATVRGLARHLGDHIQLCSALVVKDPALQQRLQHLCSLSHADVEVVDASERGYGKVSTAQFDAIEQLYVQSGVLLDPLYNGKAYAVALALAEQGKRVHLLHTGGVQGWRGMAQRGLLSEHPHLARAVVSVETGLFD